MLALFVILLAGGDEAFAANARRAAFVKKMAAYDNRLNAHAPLSIAIAYDSNREADAHTAERAFLEQGFKTTLLKTANATPDFTGVALLYVLATQIPAGWRAAVIKNGLLSVSDDVALATSGKVSVALPSVGDHVRPTVHMQHAKSEGHEFSSEFLAVAEVVGGGDDFSELQRAPSNKGKRSIEGDPWK